ncbi:glycosyltransferase family 2 protein [Candidatus Uhrbacteria bacterium]|nr:glycosyltransferase family 2 protein [Candidatus Uhrbacteria bacterium]
MTVTVAICTYNRRALLAPCLASIFRHAAEADEFLVIDDGSTDDTAAYLQALQRAHPKLRIVRHAQNQGVGAARNAALAQAQGEVLAFTDDDCVVRPGWLSALVAACGDSEVVAAYGSVIYRAPGYRGRFPERIVQNLGPAWPGAGCIAYRTAALRAVGGFDVQFGRYHNEDTEIAYRLARVGRLVPVSDAIAIHAESFWTPATLAAQSRNASVWPLLAARYGNEIFAQEFHPPIRWRHVVNAEDYLLLLGFPLLLPLLIARYVTHGGRDPVLFFAKWPCYLLLRRWHIWRAAIRHRVWMW